MDPDCLWLCQIFRYSWGIIKLPRRLHWSAPHWLTSESCDGYQMGTDSSILTKIQSHSLSCSKHLINEDLKGEKEHWAGLGWVATVCCCSQRTPPPIWQFPESQPCPHAQAADADTEDLEADSASSGGRPLLCTCLSNDWLSGLGQGT